MPGYARPRSVGVDGEGRRMGLCHIYIGDSGRRDIAVSPEKLLTRNVDGPAGETHPEEHTIDPAAGIL